MRTVMNGAFEVDAGDYIQWYWDIETNCFDIQGRRHEAIEDRRSQGVSAFLSGHSQAMTRDSAKRKAFYERGNGVFTNSPTDGNVTYNGKQNVALPKSYKPGKDGKRRVGDFMRVFARAVSGARPFEMFDIIIGRQSM